MLQKQCLQVDVVDDLESAKKRQKTNTFQDQHNDFTLNRISLKVTIDIKIEQHKTKCKQCTFRSRSSSFRRKCVGIRSGRLLLGSIAARSRLVSFSSAANSSLGSSTRHMRGQ